MLRNPADKDMGKKRSIMTGYSLDVRINNEEIGYDCSINYLLKAQLIFIPKYHALFSTKREHLRTN
jgi:hypothetical protein